jgi:membrane protease subunit HflC
VRAAADRTVVELVSSARRDSEIVRGEADAERNRIYAEAFNLDPEFFAFSRSLTSYERALTGENASMVLSPDSEFFNYLRGDGLSGGIAGSGVLPLSNVAPALDPQPEAGTPPDATLGQ